MQKVNKTQAEPVYRLLGLIEKVIARRRLDSEFHRDEVEKVFSYLIQGTDHLNAYERRDAGVLDPQWKEAIKDCMVFLKLEPKKHEKLFE